jgi:hypothetical protein
VETGEPAKLGRPGLNTKNEKQLKKKKKAGDMAQVVFEATSSKQNVFNVTG